MDTTIYYIDGNFCSLLKDTSAYTTLLQQIPEYTYSFHVLRSKELLLQKRHCGKQSRTGRTELRQYNVLEKKY